MVVNGSLAGPEIHFELRYYFAINELFITNFYCIYIYIYILYVVGSVQEDPGITVYRITLFILRINHTYIIYINVRLT